MSEATELYNELFGDESTVEETQKTKEPVDSEATAEEEEESSEETVSEDVENTDESEDEEEEEDDEESDSKPAKGNVTKALKATREELKAIREKARVSLERYEELLNDPEFLVHRAEQLKKAKESKADAPLSVEIPTAPAYPNTDRGYERMEREQIEATKMLGVHSDNVDVLEAVQGYVLQGLPYTEATRKTMKLMGLEASRYRKEGEKQTEEKVAKKTRLSTEAKPRTGTISKSQMLEKRMNSENRTERERALTESLGLV